VKALDLGPLSLINIGFSTKTTASSALGSLFGASWCLSHVEIVHVPSSTSTIFHYGAWIKRSHAQGRVDLRPGAPPAQNVYAVSVYTSDVKGAGTDADVWLTIFGRREDGSICQFPVQTEAGKGALLLASI
jgi:lipoxygenase homology domain-containing protein 1